MNAYFDGNDMVLEGYPMVINVRSNVLDHIEVMTRDALDSADPSNVFLTINHDPFQSFARTGTGSLILTKDNHGLKMVARLSQNNASREMFEAVKNGRYTKMSFRAEFLDDETIIENGVPVVYIKHLGRIFDVSIVDKPAYKQTDLKARGGSNE